MRVVVTDSGLGGLSVCAALERAYADAAVELVYVNAWPEQDKGYNDYPDDAARVDVFDRALEAMASYAPDVILIACNTLSILFPRTRFSRRAPCVVQGILEAGTALFAAALGRHPASPLVLLGTMTTIASGEYPRRLAAAGVDADRIVGVSCHGLATAIERDVHGPKAASLVRTCADDVAARQPSGAPVLVGLCCTHYGYIAGRLEGALRSALGRDVVVLDPNRRMAADVVAALGGRVGPEGRGGHASVEVVSKVSFDEATLSGVAGLVGEVSPVSAAALRRYRQVPDLF